MSIKTIITEPNKILRQKSKDVISVGKDEQKLMDDMLDTMYAANGIGLAAIQIGIPKRIIVMDISKGEELFIKATEIAMREYALLPIHHVVATWAARDGITYEQGALDSTFLHFIR